jgi:DNA polymerase III epsilon subunit-like protein
MVKILVFDTETTGLPPFQVNESDYPPKLKETFTDYNARINQIRSKSNDDKNDLEENPSLWANYRETWPYIVQLSYILFDSDTNETLVKDVYIEMLPQFTTAEYLSKAHHITRTAIEAGLNAVRVNVGDALEEFMSFFRQANVVTGHNVAFDMNMLFAECSRTNKTELFRELDESKRMNKIYCTACKATNLLQICYPYNCKKTPPIFKTPKLNEAYYRMFGYAPNESALHNALIDVVACLRVFYRLWFQGIQFEDQYTIVPLCGVGNPDIYIQLMSNDPDNEIIRIIRSFTPDGVDPAGVGSDLQICEPISTDKLTKQMGLVIEKMESRLERYNRIQNENKKRKREVGGSKKRHRKSKNNRSKKNKSKRHNYKSKRC